MDSWVLNGTESIRWLVEHPMPLFLCIVDKHLARIRVYHTSPRFYVWSMPPLPERLELVPTEDSEGVCTQWKGSNTFSLSAPVLDASVQDLLDNEFHQKAREILRFWIDVDGANLDRLKAGIHSFQMPYKYSANGHAHGGWVTQGITKAESLETPMVHIKELASYLAAQLYKKGDLAGATRCALLLRHFFHDDTSGATHDFHLHQAINKLVKGQQQYLFMGVDALNAMIDETLTKDLIEEPAPSETG
ncbi:MAG: hypothetical protein HYZ50_04025 [Deltaproteobacteria bacterium]|nr:hypothetical protein [Deltaproteobacteria bacterium]